MSPPLPAVLTYGIELLYARMPDVNVSKLLDTLQPRMQIELVSETDRGIELAHPDQLAGPASFVTPAQSRMRSSFLDQISRPAAVKSPMSITGHHSNWSLA